MYAPERHQQILDTALSRGRVEVAGLARELAVAPETVRRDLTELERRGVLRRVHGGAIAVERLGIEPPVVDREGTAAAEKDRIARAALDELPDNGSIIIDAGTTAIRFAELLPIDRVLTVVTHSLAVATILISRPNVTLHLLGGLIRTRTYSSVGDWTRTQLADVFADVAFIGTNGVSVERGLSTPDLAEARVKRALLASSRRTVVLADHSKFGREDFAKVSPLSDVDTIVTDAGVDSELADDVERAGPRVVIV
ncbi:DeoR/GlpR family DNA-binding transcription regulator [Frigoribacterium faeni]|uniref:Lactose phosphotransferase system repressor n=1 Tax=Frigoribacterium faeni TaxID=145483 RepID=A0A7W3PIK4_9MICO|nr:DeoR/GlpR family DNA-binding transcription regulator [Frigoribacterium faeni]MBA8812877.1 DeoR family fructose operon transcriptional repressor [Frigoribacterium faeni]BFF14017.1 DeoR/GlpR family DNA-binding transcription regulator [Microbacterium flavescens]GEK82505.1 DeoR family transcriptional regulator [Frigoribacterium faeni]